MLLYCYVLFCQEYVSIRIISCHFYFFLAFIFGHLQCMFTQSRARAPALDWDCKSLYICQNWNVWSLASKIYCHCLNHCYITTKTSTFLDYVNIFIILLPRGKKIIIYLLFRMLWLQTFKKNYRHGLSFLKVSLLVVNSYLNLKNIPQSHVTKSFCDYHPEHSQPIEISQFESEDPMLEHSYHKNQSVYESEDLMATIVMYLSDVQMGGEILFPDSEVRSRQIMNNLSETVQHVPSEAHYFH